MTTRHPARTAIPASRQPAVLAERGSCAGHPRAQREAAARICVTRCPVLAPCLAYAITSLPASDLAVWAGTTAAQRTVLRRRVRAAQQLLDAIVRPAA